MMLGLSVLVKNRHCTCWRRIFVHNRKEATRYGDTCTAKKFRMLLFT